jgi:uncharacterized phage-associated protein
VNFYRFGKQSSFMIWQIVHQKTVVPNRCDRIFVRAATPLSRERMVSNMLKAFEFDQETAISALLYIVSRLEEASFHRIAKVMYFADRAHLERYGRFVFGGSYRAYDYGPVPHDVYGLLKAAENKPEGRSLAGPFRVCRGKVPIVEALGEPDMDLLSASDLECLNEAIEHWGNKPFAQLTDASHDAAWTAAFERKSASQKTAEITLEDFASSLENGPRLLEHLRNPHP